MDVSYLFSKLFGTLIVGASMFMKVPQILTIYQAKSGEGVSLQSFLIEIFLYAIAFNYHYQGGYPLSTYFDYFFLLIQDITIIILIVFYAKKIDAKFIEISVAFSLFFGALFAGLCPPAVLSVLQSLTIPFFIIAKLPQIYQNYKTKATGSLSLATTIGLFAGNLMRMFTTWVEMEGEYLILFSYFSGVVINGIIITQIFMYKGNKPQHID
ncbi:hypothetical protein EIN_320600 [Entamoeba invadens IP1]|uniref:Mannose-P-dolichol utilization defect 1 protein homolog n=1 Tax=Entamoeba invadens IP1 TaxID=370355 RepID=A0A0A1U5K3_ENTIV|nr:hypothetical protein EIN_320600 [Entamoeba invadens IP1]ELP87051.1 hypothetical protein EIN_320600 [Entamoeba invadens IP1]|eukprot:XP_004253822.1 hypothetical protein EIN_320600 [Entamoeba invadens IP1]